jgi:hypothetical protein
MTRKKRLLWFGMSAVLVLVVYSAFRTGAPRHNINRASFEKLKEGMTVAEVEEIFAVPAGVYTTRPYKPNVAAEGAAEWVGDEGAVFIWFDQDTKTVRGWFVFMPETGLTWFERFQVWLGLRDEPETILMQPGNEWD